MNGSCGWPFACQVGCKTCAEWDVLYGQNIDDYLAAKADARAAVKRTRCRSGCKTQDHDSYKACLQAMRVGIAPGESAGGQW